METDMTDDSEVSEDGGDTNEIEDLNERVLVNEVLFKGLVALLVEKGVLSREEIKSHLPGTSDVIGLGKYSRTALPRLKEALAFLSRD